MRVSRKSAYAWHARWREDGVEGLRSKGSSGRPSRMKPECGPGCRRNWRRDPPRTAGRRISAGRWPGWPP
ncbi:helix-turn-helix domain-containing protein [Streptomyces sp. SID5475]|nr:helix-turn-helix domain-containing protein [Streptomyces sp. SID5475]